LIFALPSSLIEHWIFFADYAQPTMERSSAGSYLVSAEGPPFLAIGPMDKNAQLHWTFRW
jgi:hypothetical protein